MLRSTVTRTTQRVPHALMALAILAALVSVGNVSAQDLQCKIKLSDLPENAELKGFRLGMTMEQVKARVPQVVFGRTDSFGRSKTSINPYFAPRIDKSAFADVRTVSLDFLDGRLTSLWIGFDGTFKWLTLDQFVKGMSQSLSLPSAWTTWKTRGQQLRCADFQMTVSIVAAGPSFRILDLSAEETLTARRIAKEDEKSPTENNADGEETVEVLADKKNNVYYPAGCQPPTALSEADRIVFKTAEEAEKAGFQAAKNCP